MSALPYDAVTYNPPFALDLQRSRPRVWGCVLTCAREGAAAPFTVIGPRGRVRYGRTWATHKKQTGEGHCSQRDSRRETLATGLTRRPAPGGPLLATASESTNCGRHRGPAGV